MAPQDLLMDLIGVGYRNGRYDHVDRPLAVSNHLADV